MKILNLPDTHITNNKPKNRKDENFYSAIYNKVVFIQNYAVDNNISIVLQPGDYFDHHTVPKKVISDILKLIHPYNSPYFLVKWFAVYGQHDLVNHSPNVENTPLNILNSSGGVHILNNEGYDIPSENICIYGASWNEEIPEIKDESKFNILVTHRMIIKDDKIWEGQNEYIKSQHLLRKYKFDLIVSGDNHNSFTDRYRSRYLFNCGTLIRNRVDQSDHVPHIIEFDTKTRKYNKIDIPVKPFNEIMETEVHEEEKELKEKTNELVSKLRKNYEVGVDFRKKVLKTVFNSIKDERIKNFILQSIGAKEDEIKQYRKVKKQIIRRKRTNR
ncbi:MAG: metallophosphoesterase [bacterium]